MTATAAAARPADPAASHLRRRSHRPLAMISRVSSGLAPEAPQARPRRPGQVVRLERLAEGVEIGHGRSIAEAWMVTGPVAGGT